MRYFWPIARIFFCPLTILFIYLAFTEPSGNKQEQSIPMKQEFEVISLKSLSLEKIFEV
tara:strand:- start:125 stop:301 length:177 start_codon:yes stop_codon:yes gene_type:complete